MLPVLIVKMGSTLPEMSERRGDFDRWIREAADLAESDVRVVEAQQEELPHPATFRAAILSGSSAMVTDREEWSVRAAKWITQVVAAERPLLGICYGHQLIADAFGGRVEKNPRGREIGTVTIELTSEAATDRLFGAVAGLPRIEVQATHVEAVTQLPEGAVRLGANSGDANQAFSLGPRTWGVQFHPEFDADVIRTYLHVRRERVAEDGLDPDALIANARDSDHGKMLLRRFAAITRNP